MGRKMAKIGMWDRGDWAIQRFEDLVIQELLA